MCLHDLPIFYSSLFLLFQTIFPGPFSSSWNTYNESFNGHVFWRWTLPLFDYLKISLFFMLFKDRFFYKYRNFGWQFYLFTTLKITFLSPGIYYICEGDYNYFNSRLVGCLSSAIVLRFLCLCLHYIVSRCGFPFIYPDWHMFSLPYLPILSFTNPKKCKP